MSAGGFGLALFALVLALATGIDLAARRGFRLPAWVAEVRARNAGTLAATTLVGLLGLGLLAGGVSACGRRDEDVTGAIARGRGAVAFALANGGSADPSPRGSHRVPLLTAANAGDPEIVGMLLARGASLDVREGDSALALQVAARRSHHAVVSVLAAEMNRQARSLDGAAGGKTRTALHDAVSVGSVESVAVLLRAGAAPNKPDVLGQTPLHLVAAVEPNRAALIASLLVDAGGDTTAEDARGFTPLHAAAMAGNHAIVGALLRPPHDTVTARSPAGETALDVALRYRHDAFAELLLKRGGTIDREGVWPPLHEAARTDALDRVTALLAIDADTARTFRGVTALDLAKEHGSARVLALLAVVTASPGPPR